MIHKFSVTNFGPFKDEATLNFMVPSQDERDYRFIKSKSGVDLAKVLVLFGPNGSGKTRILQAFSFLRWFMLQSFSNSNPGDAIQVSPYRLCSNWQAHPTTFSLEFELDGNIYKYEVCLNKVQVLSEILTKKPKQGTKWPYVYKWEPDGIAQPKFRDESWSVPGSLPGERMNCTFFSCLLAMGYPLAGRINNALLGYGNLGPPGRLSFIRAIMDKAEFYNENSDILEDVIETMINFGIPISNIRIDEQKIENQSMHRGMKIPMSEYSIQGKRYDLPMFEESDGTIALFNSLGPMLQTLSTGGLLLLDE